MLPTLLSYVGTLALVTRSDSLECPTASPRALIPGCWGEPGCAYLIAADLGPGAACKYDYCDCGGIAVPLLPTTVQNKPTIGCGAYTTVTTTKICPTASPENTESNGPTTGPSTSTDGTQNDPPKSTETTKTSLPTVTRPANTSGENTAST